MAARKAAGFACAMTECSLSSRSKEANEWNGCTESRRICVRHDRVQPIFAAGTMRPASGRHKWRPYVFPYTGRTTGLPRRGDIHVARDTAGAAAAASLHAGTTRPASGRHKWRPYVFPYTGRTTGLPRRGDAGTMRPASGRHKWRPYVFPYTGRTTGLPRRGDIHVARNTAKAAAGAFTGGARFADPADRRYGQCDRKNGQGDRNFCRPDCFSRQGGRGGKGRQGKAST